MKNFLMFRRMVTPVLIQLLFWLGTIICWGAGLIDLASHAWLNSLLWLIAGPLVVRIFCELLILFFHMHTTLTNIEDLLEKSVRNKA